MDIAQGVYGFFSSVFGGPGFGLVALGRTRLGVLWLVAFLGCMACSIFSVWMVLAAVLVMFVAAIDAAYVGMRSPPGTFRLLRIANAVMFVGFIAAALTVRAFVVEAFKIPSSSMYPTLQIGDLVTVDKVRSVSVGDVVVFRYPCSPDHDYVFRLVAKAGDRVEVRCDVVYVNERAIPNTLADASCTYRDHDVIDDRWFDRQCSRYHETHGGRSYDVFNDAERPERDRDEAHIQSQRDFPLSETPPSCALATDGGGETQTLGRVEGEPKADPCAPGGLHYVVPPGHVFVLGDNRYNANDSRIWGSVPERDIKGRVVGIWLAKQGDAMRLSRIGAID